MGRRYAGANGCGPCQPRNPMLETPETATGVIDQWCERNTARLAAGGVGLSRSESHDMCRVCDIAPTPGSGLDQVSRRRQRSDAAQRGTHTKAIADTERVMSISQRIGRRAERA